MKLSEESINYLININNKSGVFPSALVVDELSYYVPAFDIIIYRGLNFESLEQFQEKTSLKDFPNKVGQRLRRSAGVHWTTDESIARDFAESPGPYGLLVEAIVEPSSILVEIRLLPQEVLDLLEWNSESEVILKESVSCKVIGFMKP